jgi:hypothetical protein
MTHNPDTNITMSPTAEETVILGERVMSEIPEDIQEAADVALIGFKTAIKANGLLDLARRDVALAILAERERCARIAAECAIAVPLTPGAADGAIIAARQIETAIRGEA